MQFAPCRSALRKRRSQISARVFAKLIFIVTYELMAIFATSAFTKFILSTGVEIEHTCL